MSTIDDGWLLKNVTSADDSSGSYLGGKYDDDTDSLEHTDLELWRQLSYKHWPTLFGYYNMSLCGRLVFFAFIILRKMLSSPRNIIMHFFNLFFFFFLGKMSYLCMKSFNNILTTS